ncbi:MAG: methyl-accepting chemotaxis protein [Lachnospiraceae bacterium]|nr:methyl-accepting chemotaxis protein [Lachnospiraceae bacterium]
MKRIKSIRNTRISTKLIMLGIVSVLGLFLLSRESVFTAWQIEQVSREQNDIWMNAVVTAEELNTTTFDYRIQEVQHAIATDPLMMDNLEGTINDLRAKIDEKFRIYQQLPTTDVDQEIIRQAQAVWQQYLECSDILLDTSRGNDREKATELLMGESQTYFEQASELFQEAVERTKMAARQERQQAGMLYQRLSHMQLLVIVVISSIVLVLIWSLIQAIREPSEHLAEAARRATNGNLDIHLDYKSEDEIGILTEAMNLLIRRLRDIIKDETRMFQQISNRNYEVKSDCEQAYRGDFAPLLYAFTSLQSSLKDAKERQEAEVSKLKGRIAELEKKVETYEQK